MIHVVIVPAVSSILTIIYNINLHITLAALNSPYSSISRVSGPSHMYRDRAAAGCASCRPGPARHGTDSPGRLLADSVPQAPLEIPNTYIIAVT